MSDTAALVPTQGTDYAAALAVPPVSNLRRIGGEMFAWSDSDPSRGPDRPRSALLRHLTGQFAGRGRSVLIAGPHADDLVAALVDGGATVSWLVRSLGDAENAAREHPKVTVLAGVLPRLDPEQRFDLVVAADGVERLNSVEGEQMSAGELLDRLAEAVRPDGVLLLTYDNHLGVHHTVRLDPGGREATDAAWYSIDDHDPHRPASAEQLTDRLTAAGLVVDVTYAAFPEPSAPSVLVGPGLLGNVDSPLRPRLGTALGQAFTAGFRGRAVLSDPRRLINRALRAGAESTVAPAWLIIARAPGVSAVPRSRAGSSWPATCAAPLFTRWGRALPFSSRWPSRSSGTACAASPSRRPPVPTPATCSRNACYTCAPPPTSASCAASSTAMRRGCRSRPPTAPCPARSRWPASPTCSSPRRASHCCPPAGRRSSRCRWKPCWSGPSGSSASS
ncbi:class I SAM-dependent methyltransferase [Paractinoplanes durhamensis]|uniref:hypothetical protein n=1 Tax=Paractinoplanes durhamensis TaxID=113563 RepID=UPI0036304945